MTRLDEIRERLIGYKIHLSDTQAPEDVAVLLRVVDAGAALVSEYCARAEMTLAAGDDRAADALWAIAHEIEVALALPEEA
jgi:hypothetical protein